MLMTQFLINGFSRHLLLHVHSFHISTDDSGHTLPQLCSSTNVVESAHETAYLPLQQMTGYSAVDPSVQRPLKPSAVFLIFRRILKVSLGQHMLITYDVFMVRLVKFI
jgi:hypothetical protein